MSVYSCTINISPYKKLNLKACPSNYEQFAHMDGESQKALLLILRCRLKAVIGGEWGEYQFELNKKQDYHLHCIFRVAPQVVPYEDPVLEILNKQFGDPRYNKVVDIQLCSDGGDSWINYIRKTLCCGDSTPPIDYNVFKSSTC